MDQQASWFTTTFDGMLALSFLASIAAIVVFTLFGKAMKILIKPSAEHAFYNMILVQWLGPYFIRHKIVSTFIKMNGMGETLVNCLIHTLGTFIVVAFLSSASTAAVIHIIHTGFVYSPYLLWLMAMISMLTWSLIQNLLFFRKVIYRLK